MNKLTRFYSLWRKYGEKIGLGADLTPFETTNLIDDKFANLVGKLHNHISWHIGMTAYKLIKKPEQPKVNKEENEDESEEIKKKRRVEKYREQLIQTITKSNLLSGGIEVKHLTKISESAQEELRAMATLMNDDSMI